jgi:signal transduction histidine kinase
MAQAARDLEVLQGLAGAPAPTAAPAIPGEPASLSELGPRLERVAASAGGLAVRLRLVRVTLPAQVADQLVACVGEALRNVQRHAGTDRAEVTVTGGAGWAVVNITDHGRGFDPAATPPARRGIRESITGRMLAAGGSAAIDSRPGAGTTVTVSWPA